MDELPDEVRERVAHYFSSLRIKLGKFAPIRVDPTRVMYGHKDKTTRSEVWQRAQRSGKARPGTKEQPQRQGWRKCHSENYWIYYAKYPASAVDQLADLLS